MSHVFTCTQIMNSDACIRHNTHMPPHAWHIHLIPFEIIYSHAHNCLHSYTQTTTYISPLFTFTGDPSFTWLFMLTYTYMLSHACCVSTHDHMLGSCLLSPAHIQPHLSDLHLLKSKHSQRLAQGAYVCSTQSHNPTYLCIFICAGVHTLKHPLSTYTQSHSPPKVSQSPLEWCHCTLVTGLSLETCLTLQSAIKKPKMGCSWYSMYMNSLELPHALSHPHLPSSPPRACPGFPFWILDMK